MLLLFTSVMVNLEPIYRYFRIDSGHVSMRPSEAIVVLLKELDEGKVEFRVDACSTLDLVVLVVGMDADIIVFVYAWLIGLWVFS